MFGLVEFGESARRSYRTTATRISAERKRTARVANRVIASSRVRPHMLTLTLPGRRSLSRSAIMAGASMLEAIRVPSVDGPDSFRHFLGQPGVKLRRDLIDLAIRGLLQAPAF